VTAGARAPMIGTILRLAWPTTVISLMQAVALVAETTLVGRLGTEALAAYALVLPLSLLMGMMSTGAMGGGVTSALARTLGAGRLDEARALVLHALLIGGGLGLAFTFAVELFAEPMFEAMGGRSQVLAQAAGFARAQFVGVPFLWLSGTLAALLRGAGRMRLPAVVLSLACACPLLAARWEGQTAAASALRWAMAAFLLVMSGPVWVWGRATEDELRSAEVWRDVRTLVLALTAPFVLRLTLVPAGVRVAPINIAAATIP
jgi:O-antigen/teichoic acid export membrane protein